MGSVITIIGPEELRILKILWKSKKPLSSKEVFRKVYVVKETTYSTITSTFRHMVVKELITRVGHKYTPITKEQLERRLIDELRDAIDSH